MSIIEDLDRSVQALQALSVELKQVADQKQRNAAAIKAIAEQTGKHMNIEQAIIEKVKKDYNNQYLADASMDIAIDEFYESNWDNTVHECNTVLTNSGDLVQRLAAHAMLVLAAKMIATPDDADIKKQVLAMRKAGVSK